jgi:hypothetical protein
MDNRIWDFVSEPMAPVGGTFPFGWKPSQFEFAQELKDI